jgi:hypothetical protein
MSLNTRWKKSSRGAASVWLIDGIAAPSASLVEAQTNRQMNQKSGVAQRFSRQRFTEKQGAYLAFIHRTPPSPRRTPHPKMAENQQSNPL